MGYGYGSSYNYLEGVEGIASGYGLAVEDDREEVVDLDLLRVLPEYYRVRDALLGEHQVKSKREKYLPPPTSTSSAEDKARYEVYLERADFWNYTQRFHSSLIGQIFLNNPKIMLPPRLEFLKEDADGLRTPLIQVAKAAFSYLLAYARCGLYADFPVTGGMVTRDMADRYRPSIKLISPFKIVSWQRNNENELVGVLIEEEYREMRQFVSRRYLQYRNLTLRDGKYRTGIYTPEETIRLGTLSDLTCISAYLSPRPLLKLKGDFESTDAMGMNFEKLPFEFVGASDNRETVDRPPLYPVASANLSDYRTSADTEEMLFLGGQPTVWISNPDPQHFSEQFPDGVKLGSRAILPLGDGGRAGVVQIGASDALTSNMRVKRERLADLGVPIHDSEMTRRSATEVSLESVLNHSVLASSAQNLSTAMTSVLRHAARFVGANEDAVMFELDVSQTVRNLTVEERQQNIAELNAGLMSRSEARSHLERGGKTFQEFDEAITEIEGDTMRREAMMNMRSMNNNNNEEEENNGD